MDDDRYAEKCRRLIAEIEADARETQFWTGRARFAEPVMAALARVPRHLFVPPGDEPYAYINRPLGIGFGQTISQPYIVALMTDLLDLVPGQRVLEIGTGSGYQTAVLAELTGPVFSIESVAALAEAAAERLAAMGYADVSVRHGDGFAGWPEAAPFDAIIVTAAPERMPEALIDQLAPGGRMVVPIGAPYSTQILTLIRKDAEGRVSHDGLLPVAFVPMRPGPADSRR